MELREELRLVRGLAARHWVQSKNEKKDYPPEYAPRLHVSRDGYDLEF